MKSFLHTRTISAFLVALLLSSCSNTKVKNDITEKSEIEKADFSSLVLFNGTYEPYVIDTDYFEISDEELDGQLNESLSAYQEYEKITDEVINKDDTVSIKVAARYNGELLNNYYYLDTLVDLSDNEMPDFITDAIIGIDLDEEDMVQTTTDIQSSELSFMEDNDIDVEDNETVTVNVYIIINYIQGDLYLPEDEELDDIVKQATNYEYSYASDYIDHLEEILIDEKKTQLLYDVLDDMIETGYVSFNGSIDTYERAQKKALEEYYEECAANEDVSLEQFGISIGFYDMNDFISSIDETSGTLTKEKLILYSLSENNEWNVADDEYITSAKALATKYGYDSLSDAISVYGSDALRWEVFKYAVIDDFCSKYVEGYTYTVDDESSSEIDNNSSGSYGEILVER